MKSRGRMRSAAGACVLGIAAFIVLLSVPTAAQQKNARKLDKVQLQEAQALTDAVDWAQAGRPLPSDVPVKLETEFFFKASNGQTYIPFTLAIDASQFSNPVATFLLRVVKKGEPARADTEKGKKPTLPPPTYEDLQFPTLKAEGGQPAKLDRAFQVPGGEYDVYIGVKERNPQDKNQKAKVSVYKHDLKVPEFAGPSPALVTSSLVVADRIDTLTAPLKPEQMREQPYAIGALQIVPKAGTAFAKNQELNVYFQIYNAVLDAAGKPDVLIEFGFFQRKAEAEKKVFNSDPSVLNASTLIKEFDPAKHQLAGGGVWPLTSFPPGDYRLEIKVTDKVAGKSLTQSVNFSVS